MKMNIKKGDQVKIISGKNRGKSGAVLSVFSSVNKISVEGVNLYKKRSKPKNQGQKGETVLVARPFAVSNAMLICKNCKVATRIGFRLEGKQKSRYCKKCSANT